MTDTTLIKEEFCLTKEIQESLFPMTSENFSVYRAPVEYDTQMAHTDLFNITNKNGDIIACNVTKIQTNQSNKDLLVVKFKQADYSLYNKDGAVLPHADHVFSVSLGSEAGSYTTTDLSLPKELQIFSTADTSYDEEAYKTAIAQKRENKSKNMQLITPTIIALCATAVACYGLFVPKENDTKTLPPMQPTQQYTPPQKMTEEVSLENMGVYRVVENSANSINKKYHESAEISKNNPTYSVLTVAERHNKDDNALSFDYFEAGKRVTMLSNQRQRGN